MSIRKSSGEHLIKRFSYRAVAATIAITLCLIACDPNGSAQAANESLVDKAGTVRVEVAKPQRRQLTRKLRMPATLLAGQSADLYAKTSGYISAINVDIGSRVKKDDPLLTIDVPEMFDELEQAQAVLEAKRARVRALQAQTAHADAMIVTARAQVQRYDAEHDLSKITADRKRQLREANAIPEQDYDEAAGRLAMTQAQLHIVRANVAGAEAQKQSVEANAAVARAEVAVEEANVARLKTLMDYTTIRAPFDGIITDRPVDPGAFVRSAADGPSTPLLTIDHAAFIRLALEIPESDAPWVRVGTPVTIDIKALDAEPIEASVTRTAQALKVNTRTMRVEVDLDNKEGRLAPGMYAQATVTLETREQAMMIPSKAIRVRGKEISVLVAENAVARTKPITIGYDDGIWAEIKTGLTGDEQVIVSSGGALAPGAPIKVAPAG